MTKILIAGATGTAGQTLTNYFSQQKDVAVFGITSNPENTQIIEKLGAAPVIADLTNEDETLKIFRGIQPDVVLSSVISRGESAIQQEQEMGQNLVQASAPILHGWRITSIITGLKSPKTSFQKDISRISSDLKKKLINTCNQNLRKP